jgi:hypothetical protein
MPSDPEWYNVFHEACDNCDTPTDNPKLCQWCHHLRLKHLLFCDSAPSWVELNLGSFDDIQPSKNCGFHRLLYQATEAYVNAMKPGIVPISSLQFSLVTYRQDDIATSHASMAIEVNGEDYSAGFDAFRAYLEDFEQAQAIIDRVPVSGLIDWHRISGWLNRCTLEHEECQPLQIGALPNGFRVIDVVERRVVTPSPDCRFVALSYVWGKTPDPTKTMATLSTIKDLEQRGGLEVSKMPLVIEDAIQTCILLKQRYLWADRLCIVQDDLVNKQEQIDGMVAIYASAVFALVIAYGDNMNTQIPGVSLHRQTRTSHLQFGGLLVENILPDFKQTIENTAWSTRGWTYQESILPTRKLFLTGVQVMYECQRGLLHEDNALNEDSEYEVDLPLRFYGLPSSLFSRSENNAGFEYTRHVSAYNARSLTYISDVYNALAAITGALYGPVDSLVHGLPLKDFDHALLWHPDGESKYEPRSPLDIWLPSWSWSSVSGRLEYLTFYGSLLQWAVISGFPPSQHTKLIGTDRNIPSKWAEMHMVETSKSQNILLPSVPQIYMALAWAEGCFETGIGFETRVLSEKSFKELGAELIAQWPSYADFCTNTLSTKTLIKAIPTLPEENITIRNKCTIATHAQVTYLGLGIHRSGESRYCRRSGSWYDILDDDQRIGLLGPSTDLDSPHIREDLQASSFKFIGLSISGCTLDLQCIFHDRLYAPPEKGRTAGNEYIEDKELDITYWDCNNVPLSPVPVVNVMLIGERKGLSCRLAVGWILLKKWAKLSRHSETIFLI